MQACQILFDRALDFGNRSPIDVQLGKISRIVTSRSQDKKNIDSRLVYKRDVKISTVEMDISALRAVKVADTKERKEKIVRG